jgi:hypothetical protein
MQKFMGKGERTSFGVTNNYEQVIVRERGGGGGKRDDRWNWTRTKGHVDK